MNGHLFKKTAGEAFRPVTATSRAGRVPADASATAFQHRVSTGPHSLSEQKAMAGFANAARAAPSASFRRASAKAGDDDYPFNTRSLGRQAPRGWAEGLSQPSVRLQPKRWAPMSARKSEMRRKALLLKLPKDFQEFKSWPREASRDPEDELDRYDGLCKAADLFKKQCVADLAKAAGHAAPSGSGLHRDSTEPWKEGNGITGTRACPLQSAEQPVHCRPPAVGSAGRADRRFQWPVWQALYGPPGHRNQARRVPERKQRPNKIGDKTLHTKFQAICKEEGLTDEDYPFAARPGVQTAAVGSRRNTSLNTCLHIKKNSGKARA